MPDVSPGVMRAVGRVLGSIVAVFCLARAVAEPFVIDLNDPTTYQRDWGGPHLAGVLAVHCGPGLVAASIMGRALLRGARSRRQVG